MLSSACIFWIVYTPCFLSLSPTGWTVGADRTVLLSIVKQNWVFLSKYFEYSFLWVKKQAHWIINCHW